MATASVSLPCTPSMPPSHLSQYGQPRPRMIPVIAKDIPSQARRIFMNDPQKISPVKFFSLILARKFLKLGSSNTALVDALEIGDAANSMHTAETYR
jgi:hypothetical protein